MSHFEISSHVKESPNDNYLDRNGHGTHIAGLILKDTCQEVELVSCNFTLDNPTKSALTNSIECFKRALTENIDIINYSAGGESSKKEEFEILKQVSNKGIKIIVAAGNNGQDLRIYDYYPAKYKLENLIPVGNWNAKSSNYGLKNMVWENGQFVHSTLPDGRFGYMSGTSQAAALHTNRLLREMCNEKK